MTTARLAFVGSARDVSPWLLQSIARVGTFEAICGRNAEEDIRRYHARWAFKEPAALLKEAEPQGVVLSLPLAGRPHLIKECLAAGVGVLVLGMPASASACTRLHSFAKLSARVLCAAPAIRFSPAVLVARRLVASGKFAAPLSMSVTSTLRKPPSIGDRADLSIAGDQVFEAVDLVNHLVGPIAQVFAVSHEEGSLAVTGLTDGGVPVSIVCHARGAAELVGIEFELRASDGARLRMDRNCRLSCGNGSRVDAFHAASLGEVDPALELGFEGLVADFGRRLLGKSDGAGVVPPARAVVAMTEAILSSASKRRVMAPRIQGSKTPADAGQDE